LNETLAQKIGRESMGAGMSQRLERKDMKRDDLATAVERGVDFAESHTRQVLITAGVVVGLLLIGFLTYFYANHRSDAANEALSAAVRVYQAPVLPSGAKPDDAKEPSFATEAARQAKAKKMLEDVRDTYHFTDASDVASIYIAELDAAAGKLDLARQLWSDFVKKHGDHVLAAQARIDLMELDRNQGKGQQVATQLREMLDQSDAPLPQDVILAQLATTLELLHRDQEAVQTYQRILDEFPQSPYRSSAQQKITALDPTRASSGPQTNLGGAIPAS
jgi:TolA-binding protein